MKRTEPCCSIPHPLSSAEASMIDCVKIGEKSVPHGGLWEGRRRGNRASAPAPPFFPSSPMCPLSPLFYLPPPLGSLCGGERSHTIERKWSSPNQKAPGSSDIRHEHDTSVGTASWLISSILYFQLATCNMGPPLIESIEHSRHTQSMNLSID